MKKYLFPLIIMAVVFVSCPDNGESVLPPGSFDREIFNRERQLWLEQDIQNYAFQEAYDTGNAVRGEKATIFVKNGNFRYFRNSAMSNHQQLFLPNTGALFPESLQLSISDLYAYIENYANYLAYYSIDIEYDDELHFPKYVYCLRRWAPAGKQDPGAFTYHVFTLKLSNFVIDPEIPEETSLVFDRELFNLKRQEWVNANCRNYRFFFYFWFMYNEILANPSDDSWAGTIIVKDGTLHELIPEGFYKDTQPGGAAKAWIGTIDELFAKIQEEADSYDGRGGLLIDVDYKDPNQRIYYLRISPDSPDEDVSFEIRIGAFERLD